MKPRPAALRRRRALTRLAGLSLAPLTGGLAARALAQTPPPFPLRPVTLWVPWPAGGATDLTMRLLADAAARTLGQPVVVNNRPGAGGTLAMPILQQAPADGYTIAQLPHPVFRAPHLQHLLWDPIRDTTPLIQISGVTFGMLVPADGRWQTLDELLAWAQAHPGRLTVATNGVGTTPHVVLDTLFARHGVDWVHVPYRGTAEQMVALASGQVMAGVNSNGFAPFVDDGSLRLLATFGEQRTRRWPQVPTLKELGHGLVAQSPYGLAGPRGLSPSVVQVLHDAFRLAMNDPAHRVALQRHDQEPAYLGSAAYGQAMRDAYAAEQRAAERLGLARGLT